MRGKPASAQSRSGVDAGGHRGGDLECRIAGDHGRFALAVFRSGGISHPHRRHRIMHRRVSRSGDVPLSEAVITAWPAVAPHEGFVRRPAALLRFFPSQFFSGPRATAAFSPGLAHLPLLSAPARSFSFGDRPSSEPCGPLCLRKRRTIKGVNVRLLGYAVGQPCPHGIGPHGPILPWALPVAGLWT